MLLSFHFCNLEKLSCTKDSLIPSDTTGNELALPLCRLLLTEEKDTANEEFLGENVHFTGMFQVYEFTNMCRRSAVTLILNSAVTFVSQMYCTHSNV